MRRMQMLATDCGTNAGATGTDAATYNQRLSGLRSGLYR